MCYKNTDKICKNYKIAIHNVGYDVAIYSEFLGALAEVWKAATSTVMSVCLHGTTRLRKQNTSPFFYIRSYLALLCTLYTDKKNAGRHAYFYATAHV